MPGTHALLSASGAKRWLSCTPSARLEQQFREEESSYAAEGTFAHSLAELILRYNNGELTKQTFTRRYNKMKEDSFYNKELDDYVSDYTKMVWEIINETKASCPDALMLFEQRLDFSEYVPDGFGTCDVVIVADDVVNVIDLKYGKSIGVSAEDNPQLRLYSVGAYVEHSMLYDIQRVRMTIIQPRLDNVSIEELTAEELLVWAHNEVGPKAKLAIDGEGDFCVGDHCRFCKARKTCRARAEYNLDLAKYEFADSELLSGDEIGEILKKADELARWVTDITGYALTQALKGEKFDGWKLVEGLSRRKYMDKEQVAATLMTAGYHLKDIYKPEELIGITDMTKLLGKKQFEELLSDLVVKPEGKPTLVPETDKRPELNSVEKAKREFEEES